MDMAKEKTTEKKTLNLKKLNKKQLLEIMLAQGEEIDALRKENEELKEKLEERKFDLDHIGSIAEASLAVTDIFKEAEKAALVYLENVRNRYE